MVKITPWLDTLCVDMHDMSKQHYMNCHVLTVVVSHDLQVLFNTTISHSSSLLCRLPSRTQGVHANGKDGKTQKLRFVWTHVFWASATGGFIVFFEPECGNSSCNWLTYCLILVRHLSDWCYHQFPNGITPYFMGAKLPVEWPWRTMAKGNSVGRPSSAVPLT